MKVTTAKTRWEEVRHQDNIEMCVRTFRFDFFVLYYYYLFVYLLLLLLLLLLYFHLGRNSGRKAASKTDESSMVSEYGPDGKKKTGPKKGSSWAQKCKYCGKPRKGHVCEARV